jgi:glucose 1-dehydrogenase
LFAINVRGTYMCIHAATDALASGGGGFIVNLSPVHAFAGLPPPPDTRPPGAINSMRRSLAIELVDRRIRVNAVAPGLVEVARYFTQDRAVPYDSEMSAQMVPWGRVGTARRGLCRGVPRLGVRRLHDRPGDLRRRRDP